MKKRIKILSAILLIFIAYQAYQKYTPRPLIKNIETIFQITIYNSETHESINISDKSEIKEEATKWNRIIVKRDKLVWNTSKQNIVVMTYNNKGETLETFYLSKEGINQYHWKLQIIEGSNPYNELSHRFQ